MSQRFVDILESKLESPTTSYDQCTTQHVDRASIELLDVMSMQHNPHLSMYKVKKTYADYKVTLSSPRPHTPACFWSAEARLAIQKLIFFGAKIQTESLSYDQLKRAWRELAKKIHPDQKFQANTTNNKRNNEVFRQALESFQIIAKELRTKQS